MSLKPECSLEQFTKCALRKYRIKQFLDSQDEVQRLKEDLKTKNEYIEELENEIRMNDQEFLKNKGEKSDIAQSN